MGLPLSLVSGRYMQGMSKSTQDFGGFIKDLQLSALQTKISQTCSPSSTKILIILSSTEHLLLLSPFPPEIKCQITSLNAQRVNYV